MPLPKIPKLILIYKFKSTHQRCVQSIVCLNCIYNAFFDIDIDRQIFVLSLNIVIELTLCTDALLPELKPAPCFLSAIIAQT